MLIRINITAEFIISNYTEVVATRVYSDNVYSLLDVIHPLIIGDKEIANNSLSGSAASGMVHNSCGGCVVPRRNL